MKFSGIVLIALSIFVLSGALFASGCATSAYVLSCNSCTFDSNGKMDQACSKEKQNGGIGCLASSHAIMSAAYAAGKCPQIDACTSALNSCKSSRATGDDKKDCESGAIYGCFTEADACVEKAAPQCGEKTIQTPCSGTPLMVLLLGSVFLYSSGRREKK